VRVGAAAVNFPDVLFVADQYQLTVPVPFVPGSEFASVVLEVGPGVSGVSVGDRVMGTTTVGAFAEEAVVPASSVSLVPSRVPDASATAFGVAHRTAYHVLRSVARVQSGERLVVLGAGGGVGLAAVQLGALLGASVTAVASSDAKLSVALSYGAASAINHSWGDLRQALRSAFPDGVDVVVDPAGGDLAEPALRALNLVLLKGCQILGFRFRDFAAHAGEELARNEAALLELLAAGKALPHIGATFKLAEAAAALRYVADGKAIGKVVLAIA
jgi:NADPH2:quinone reductase